MQNPNLKAALDNLQHEINSENQKIKTLEVELTTAQNVANQKSEEARKLKTDIGKEEGDIKQLSDTIKKDTAQITVITNSIRQKKTLVTQREKDAADALKKVPETKKNLDQTKLKLLREHGELQRIETDMQKSILDANNKGNLRHSS